MINGPNIMRLQLRDVPSGWGYTSRPCGLDVEAEAELLRKAAEKREYLVEPGYVVEDLRRDTAGRALEPRQGRTGLPEIVVERVDDY